MFFQQSFWSSSWSSAIKDVVVAERSTQNKDYLEKMGFLLLFQFNFGSWHSSVIFLLIVVVAWRKIHENNVM